MMPPAETRQYQSDADSFVGVTGNDRACPVRRRKHVVINDRLCHYMSYWHERVVRSTIATCAQIIKHVASQGPRNCASVASRSVSPAPMAFRHWHSGMRGLLRFGRSHLERAATSVVITAVSSATSTLYAPGRQTLERWDTPPAAAATGSASRARTTNRTICYRRCANCTARLRALHGGDWGSNTGGDAS
jgi:hypothetical protein